MCVVGMGTFLNGCTTSKVVDDDLTGEDSASTTSASQEDGAEERKRARRVTFAVDVEDSQEETDDDDGTWSSSADAEDEEHRLPWINHIASRTMMLSKVGEDHTWAASWLDSFLVYLVLTALGIMNILLLLAGMFRVKLCREFQACLEVKIPVIFNFAYGVILCMHAVACLAVVGCRQWFESMLTTCEFVFLVLRLVLSVALWKIELTYRIAADTWSWELGLGYVISTMLIFSPSMYLTCLRAWRRWARMKVSENRVRLTEDGFDLDLTYITDNIIAMSFPATGGENAFRNDMEEVKGWLNMRHPHQHKVYNLCAEADRRYDIHVAFHSGSQSVSMLDHNPCPLEDLHRIVEDQHRFLEKPGNVVAIHCKAGKGRTGFVVACLLLRERVVASASEALELYAEKRTHDGKGVTIPSQIRYVHLYELSLREGYIRGGIVHLLELRIYDTNLSNWFNSSCQPFIEVTLPGDELVLESDSIRTVAPSSGSAGRMDAAEIVFDLRDTRVALRGDFNVSVKYNSRRCTCSCQSTHTSFSFWLHSGYVPAELELQLEEMDGVKHHRKRFPHESMKVKCTFE